MKTVVLSIGHWLLMSIGAVLCWILGFGLSQAIFKVPPPETGEDSSKTLVLLFLMILLEMGVLLWAQLLLPNPFMPEEIRYPHLLETASSTFIWGFVVAWMLLGKAMNRHNESE